MTFLRGAVCGVTVTMFLCAGAGQAAPLPALEVSANGHHLVRRTNGGVRPFFWLGDTAWRLDRLAGKADPADLNAYLDDRAARGFNVIQGPTPGFTSLTTGYTLEADTNRPTLRAEYLVKLDKIVDAAEARGLYVAILPMWADQIIDLEAKRGAANATADLERLGADFAARYGNRSNVVFVAGGEGIGEARLDLVKALGRGLNTSGTALITAHPTGNASSSTGTSGTGPIHGGAHADGWLDFNMIQGDEPFQALPLSDWNRSNPVKPTLQAELGYEWLAPGLPGNSQADGRRAAYVSVFSGSAGFTYGHTSLAFFRASDDAGWDANNNKQEDWREALAAGAGKDMVHLRRLMESRPMLSRLPDPARVVAGQVAGVDHIAVTRDVAEGGKSSYLMAYLTGVRGFTLDTAVFGAAALLDAWCFDPLTGASTLLRGGFANTGTFTPDLTKLAPNTADWVLVVDDRSAGYAAPGLVPEPASLPCAGLAGAALVMRRRRR